MTEPIVPDLARNLRERLAQLRAELERNTTIAPLAAPSAPHAAQNTPGVDQDTPATQETAEAACKCPPGLAYRCHHRTAPIGSSPRAGEPDLRAEVQRLTQERDEARAEVERLRTQLAAYRDLEAQL